MVELERLRFEDLEDFAFEDLRLKVPEVVCSLCPVGDPPLVLGLLVEVVGVFLPPNMFPPLNGPPPCEGVVRCISGATT